MVYIRRDGGICHCGCWLYEYDGNFCGRCGEKIEWEDGDIIRTLTPKFRFIKSNVKYRSLLNDNGVEEKHKIARNVYLKDGVYYIADVDKVLLEDDEKLMKLVLNDLLKYIEDYKKSF